MEENRKVIIAVIGFIGLLLILGGVYFFFFRDTGEEQMPEEPEVLEETIKPPDSEKTETISEEPVAVLDMTLADSDSRIKELAASLSSHPEFAKYLLTKNMIRKFVAIVDNIASGHSPKKHIDFFTVQEEFKTISRDGIEYIDPESYRRYTVVAQVFSSLDVAGSVELFRRSYPVIQEAYRELGYPEGDFLSTLHRAIDELLQVPVMEKDIALEAKVLSYEYVDPELQEMSAAQKHLFRMGPANVRWIQAKLKDFKAQLK